VVTFDATMPGTSAAAWNSLVATAREFDIEPYTELLVIAAHPDDETLGAAGLIARFADSGRPVRVVVVTDGAASHPHFAPVTPAELARLRAEESRRALALLAPEADLELFGFPDGATREHSSRISDALRLAISRTAATALVAAPWHGDGHRDHRVVSEAVARVIEDRALVEYPIWMWHWATPDDDRVPPLAIVSIDRARKSAAIAEHESQLTAWGAAPAVLASEFVEHFHRDVEVLIDSEHSLGGAYFDELYARRDDPWRLATRWYEQRKRAITVASLPRHRFVRGLEIGSSVGMLTAMLQDRCDELVAVDISAAAVDATRARVGDRVSVRQADVTQGLPRGPFDLVVVSEVGYYLSPGALGTLVNGIVALLADDAVVVVCHWRHPVPEYLQGGDAVQELIASRIGLARVASHLESDFALDIYATDPRSVAAREGLV
jgi:LmbE family N-acetylglucosaminyl deacetylase